MLKSLIVYTDVHHGVSLAIPSFSVYFDLHFCYNTLWNLCDSLVRHKHHIQVTNKQLLRPLCMVYVCIQGGGGGGGGCCLVGLFPKQTGIVIKWSRVPYIAYQFPTSYCVSGPVTDLCRYTHTHTHTHTHTRTHARTHTHTHARTHTHTHTYARTHTHTHTHTHGCTLQAQVP